MSEEDYNDNNEEDGERSCSSSGKLHAVALAI